MTMFTLPNFCRVCLKYDKNLIDLAHIENEPSETLMSKLQVCVSEVEWKVFKPLLCHPCIKRLNVAYNFKRQCVQSSGVLKNYVELVKESQKKGESHNPVKSENVVPTTGGAYMLLPNQKYVKIVVGSQNQTPNTFQNVFLNLIPATPLNSGAPTPASVEATTAKSKDTNQNVFLNLNQTFQKYISTPPTGSPKRIVDPHPNNVNNVNVNQLLTESKTEELSVEIDPTDFGLEEEEEDSNEEEEACNDYDEVISSAKITLKDLKSNGEKTPNGKEDQKHYVPILPKNQHDFFSSGQHFLFSSTENTGAFTCESCQKPFATKKLLKAHINQFHLGKLPFKCEYCYTEFATRAEYDVCIGGHRKEAETLNNSLTLQDFANNSLNESQMSEVEAHIPPSENGEYVCDVCRRPFSSSTGLLRHKVRKHNQKNKKKYFIKGMKNAKCDICNREFSTQSYMQLHRKLHLRDDIGYKYKVFGKSKYGELDASMEEKDASTEEKDKDKGDEEVPQEKDPLAETLDVTPDIFTEEERKSDEDSNDGGGAGPKTEESNDSIKMEVDEEGEEGEEPSESEGSQNGEKSNHEHTNDEKGVKKEEEEED